MDELKIDPTYVPPPIEGYVWYSNFSLFNYPTKEDVLCALYQRFGLLLDQFQVEPFNGHWAGYVREAHKEKVVAVINELTFMIGLCERMMEVMKDDRPHH